MRILLDQNISAARNLFDTHGEVILADGRSLSPADVRDIDALIIRSVTRVDAALLQHSAVRFVGTTTIGTDHLDIPYLDQRGIGWASAPGCNADSAAQYTLAMIMLACQRKQIDLSTQTAGIIGRGNVGSRVQRLLHALGVSTVANDPPLAERRVTGLVSLNEALQQDIVCLHVPLTRQGKHPTWQLIGKHQLRSMKPDSILVNSARGDVVDGGALLDALRSGSMSAALDVWPGEPGISRALVKASTVATPHVAGYSYDGKFNGAQQVYRAFCSWAEIKPLALNPLPTEPTVLDLTEEPDGVAAAIHHTCFVHRHDQLMNELAELTEDRVGNEFDRLRRTYPRRRDFGAWRVRCTNANQARLLTDLGFEVISSCGLNQT